MQKNIYLHYGLFKYLKLILNLPMKAIATESLRLYPPDNVPAKSFVFAF